MLSTLLVLILTSNALNLKNDHSIYYSRTTIIGLIYGSYIIYNNFLLYLDNGIGIFGGLFNITSFTNVFNLFIFLVTAIILLLTGFYPRKIYIKELSSIFNLMFKRLVYNKDIISNKGGGQFNIIEYALITIFVLSGGIFLMSSADLVSIFLSIELQSYGLYILSTLYRDSELATGSGLTYFLLGGLASCFILLGSALIYAITGTTNLENIYIMTNVFNNILYPNVLIETSNFISYDFSYLEKIYFIQLAIIVMAVGFLFKVSAAPFHFWSPDVYDGIPTIVTTFVAIVAKISIFAFFLYFVYNTEYYLFNFSWKNILIISSLLSLIIGSLLGLTQFRIKRLYAYSTISHIGFILLALSIQTAESVQSYIFYILQYSISNLNAFIILVTIGFTLFLNIYKEDYKHELIDQNNSPVQLINQIKGYFYINPYIAISLAITLFSFIGIPPVIGFFGKQMILSAALDNGYVFMSLVCIITSVIGAGYYLNLVKNIFFFKDSYITNPYKYTTVYNNKEKSINNSNNDNSKYNNNNNVSYMSYLIPYEKGNTTSVYFSKTSKIAFTSKEITINSSLSTSISIITLILILFIYTPTEWFNLVNILTLNLFSS